MDAREEIQTSDEAVAASDLDAVRGVFDRIARDGVVAGVAQMLTFCHDDVQMRSYLARAESAGVARDDLLVGKDAVLDFFESREAKGFAVQVRPRGFDLAGDDTVAVRGSTRVSRPDGSFAETSLTWKFHFRAGLVDEIAWEPRAGA